jgi:hypothetical protein
VRPSSDGAGVGIRVDKTTPDGKTIHQKIAIYPVRWSLDAVSRALQILSDSLQDRPSLQATTANLSYSQLERIANGEAPTRVLLNRGYEGTERL